MIIEHLLGQNRTLYYYMSKEQNTYTMVLRKSYFFGERNIRILHIFALLVQYGSLVNSVVLLLQDGICYSSTDAVIKLWH